MKSQILSILRQGIWASLTGGWYYDHNQTHFLNIFHLYTWLFLFSLPIVTYYFFKKFFPIVFLPTNFNSAWIFYCILISIFFLIVKLFNQYLHDLFDKNKFKTDPTSKDKQQKKNDKRDSGNKDLQSGQRLTLFHENGTANESNNENQIKMVNLNRENLNLHENPISSYETGNDCIIFQNSKTKVDVHHRNNSENSSLAEISSNSSLLMDSVSMRNKIYKNSSLNTTENLSKKCMLSSKKDAITLENSLEEDRENDTRFETNSECKTLDGMIIVANTIINTNATNDLDKDHAIYSDKDSFNSKNKDKRYYSDGFLKGKSGTSKSNKNHQEYLEPDVKSLPTQIFFENNEVKINIQSDDLESINQNVNTGDHQSQKRASFQHSPITNTPTTNSPNTSLVEDSHNTAKELSCAKKRFKSEEFIHSTLPNDKLSVKMTKSLANVVSYSPNDHVPFKTTIIPDSQQFLIEKNHSGISKKRSPAIKTKKSSKHHRQTVRLEEEPIPSTSTGITHNEDNEDNNPPDDLIKKVLNVSGTFLAKSHDDTSIGAVHCFQDEKGNWLTYMFDKNSFGIAQGLKEFKTHDTTTSLDESNKQSITSSSRQQHSQKTNQKESYSSTNNFFIDYEDNQTESKAAEGNSINRMREASKTNEYSNNYVLDFLTPSLQSLNQTIDNQPSIDLNQSNVSGLMQNMIMHQNLAFNNNLNSSFLNESSISYREFPNQLSKAHNFSSRSRVKPNQFYNLRLPLMPKDKSIKIKLDRLTLLALLDPCLTKLELYMSILLAILVAIFGSIIIEEEIFTDLKLILFCFVIASSQYTLIKSVQPDAASPTHGYNRIIVYSRPVYFILISIIVLLTKYYREHKIIWSFTLYNTNLLNPVYVEVVEQCMKLTLLLFPVIFTFGFLPQINTFFMHLLEQIDCHIFGGSASTTGLTSALYSVLRSFLFVNVLFGFGILSITHTLQFKSLTNFSVNDYNAMFSVFCALLILFAYLLSRYSSDPTDIFNLTKKYYTKFSSALIRTYRRLTDSNKKAAAKSKRLRNTKKDSKTHSTEEMEDLKTPDDNENESDCETIQSMTASNRSTNSEEIEYEDPLPKKLERTLIRRLENDLICSIFITIMVFAVHVSTIFKLQPYVENTLRYLAISLGFFLNYILPQMRKELPWLCFAKPFLQTKERSLFEVKSEAKIMWFDRLRVFLWLFEKNVVYPLVFLSAITIDTPLFLRRFGVYSGLFLMIICAFKCVRSSFNDSSPNFIILLFTYLIFQFDLKHIKEPFLLNYFFISILYHKIVELILKLEFVAVYIAPWQITWGSAFHAFAQPASFPHSSMLFLQAIISSIISSPLQPILGSTLFLASYVRPTKFWERDYNTKRVDSTNTRLISHLERNPYGSDDNNLNSIFYEHLTRELQHSLYGDLMLGRWGNVVQGDCFVMASENLNCLVHIIELANGLVTFQVRGLEFRGTYCQQREVEAINERIDQNHKCCCFSPGHLYGMISFNAAFNLRWMVWQITQTKYVLDGYTISDNLATPMVVQFEYRKNLITHYVKCVIFYTIMDSKLSKWLKDDTIRSTLDAVTNNENFVDLDASFNVSIEEDFDETIGGITRQSFSAVYGEWLKYCLQQRKQTTNPSLKSQQQQQQNKSPSFTLTGQEEEALVTLCFCLSLVARRLLIAASHNNSINTVEFFLDGVHALFKGDFRISAPRDEWVFYDMDLLKKIIAPSIRMSLKLHQDHFISSEEFEEKEYLFSAIVNYRKEVVISHESDPLWRNAILSNVNSLLTIRHVIDDHANQYKIIMLNKRHVSFRIVKINRECVRGLWAGQQQELIYLRNRNAERGSIQNAKQVLRNIINSSCDQPIGYPIYVSPLTTSFSETSNHLISIIGKPLNFKFFIDCFKSVFERIRLRCDQTCVSRTIPYATSNLNLASSNIIEDPRVIGDSLCSFGLMPNKSSLSNTINSSNVESSKF